jgi:hypothetical protein
MEQDANEDEYEIHNESDLIDAEMDCTMDMIENPFG